MNTNSNTPDQGISMTLPLRIDFVAIENLLKKKFIGTNLSKTDANGKISNYFKIVDIHLAESTANTYNLKLIMKLQTLTLLFNHKELEVSVDANLLLDVTTQKLYVEAYHINSHGNHWIANNILKTVLNTFIYKKIINVLSVDLTPLLNEKIEDLNTKLASKLEATQGISILGTVENFSISHFEIKENKFWVFINTSGWCIVEIEDLDF